MKKIIKLTERDLTRIVKRVINENEYNDDFNGETNYRDMSVEEEIDHIENEIYNLGNTIDSSLNQLADLQDEIEERDDFDTETKKSLLSLIEDIMKNI